MDNNHLDPKPDNSQVSLRTISYIMLAAVLVFSAILFNAIFQTQTMYTETHTVTRQVIECQKSSHNMQLASDYLTEQVRLFVIHGKKSYLDNYFEEVNVTQRRDKALEFLKNWREDSEAFSELRNAMQDSVDLMDLEYHAARLAAEAYGLDIQSFPFPVKNYPLTDAEKALSADEKEYLAEQLLFSSEYEQRKASISSHMANCMHHIEQTLWEEQANVATKLKTKLFIEHLLTIIMIVFLFIVVFLISRMVVSPLHQFVKLIDKGEAIPERGTSEIQFLARTYNTIRQDTLHRGERLRFEATHDKLTGLYNRRGYDILLDTIDVNGASLMMLDIDDFKDVNDNFGHAAGDRVLIKLAELLYEHFRGACYSCRIGGDEFAVLMESAYPATKEHLTEALESLNEMLMNDDDGIPAVSVSAGVAFLSADSEPNLETLMKYTDTALYNAKKIGKKTICFNTGGNDSDN